MIILKFCIQERLTTVRVGLSGVQKPGRTGEFSLQKFSDRFGVYAAFYSSDIGALSPGVGSGSVRQATHHHLAPSVRTIGAITPFPLYTFMKCVGTRVKDILLESCKDSQYVGSL